MNADALIHHLNWRYAVKKFDSTRKISEENWNALAESLRLSPSSFGLQPWHFFVVQNPEVRKKLTPVSWNQSQIESCSHLVVFTTLKDVREDHIDKFINQVASVRNVPIEKLQDYRKMMAGSIVHGLTKEQQAIWAQKQAYIAMGTLLTTAATLEVDACPMEGILSDKYDEILNLSSTDYTTIAVVALGYRADDDNYAALKKVRYDLGDVVELIS